MLTICNNSRDKLGENYNLQLAQGIFWVIPLTLEVELDGGPGALAQNLIEVESDGFLLNQALHLGLLLGGQNPHQSLGGKPVLGTLLVVALGHIGEHDVGGLVDVMDDLAQVALEVSRGELLKVGQGGRRNVTLPLQVALASVNESSQVGVLLHEGSEGPGELELVAGDRCLATRQSQGGLLLVRHCGPGHLRHLSHVGGEHDEVVVLVDVVHDLDLKESLGGIVHDLVGQLGLCNVLPQLLDTVASSLGCSIFVNHLVALILGLLTALQLLKQSKHNRELTTEQRVLGGVHCVLVHLEEIKVHTRHSFNKSLKRGIDLELLEEAGNGAAGGGPRESNLVGYNDWGVDGGADQGVADDVEVCLQRGGRVTDRNTPVNEAGKVSLGTLHGFREGLQLLNLDLLLLLGDGDILELAAVLLHAALNHLEELGLISFDEVAGDGSKLCIFSNLVWRPGTDWLAVDIHVGLLPQVKPDDGAVLGVDRSGDLLEDILDALECRLASGVDLVAGDPVEVRGTRQRVGQLLHLVELVGHGRSLPYFRVVRHLGEPGRQGLTEEVLDGARERS